MGVEINGRTYNIDLSVNTVKDSNVLAIRPRHSSDIRLKDLEGLRSHNDSEEY